jgi:hypothetical protein
MDADPRLAAGAGGAVRYLAESAGLEGGAAKQFQTAAVTVCEEAFSSLNPQHPQLDVYLTLFEDRIEVALAQEGDAGPALSMQELLKNSTQAMKGVDRVQFEQKRGAFVTRLTKFFGGQG